MRILRTEKLSCDKLCMCLFFASSRSLFLPSPWFRWHVTYTLMCTYPPNPLEPNVFSESRLPVSSSIRGSHRAIRHHYFTMHAWSIINGKKKTGYYYDETGSEDHQGLLSLSSPILGNLLRCASSDIL